MRVVVLILDNLPAGFLGCYGNDWIDTPALDRLAAEGVVFDRHYSDCPQAEAARRAWRTGRFPFLESNPTRTLQPPDDLFGLLDGAGIVSECVIGGAGDELQAVDAALSRLSASEHWLLWIELPTLRPPWQPSEELFARYFPMEDAAEESEPPGPLTQLPTGALPDDDDVGFLRLQSTYGALVTELDERVHQLLGIFSRRRLMEGHDLERRATQGASPPDDVLLIVTSDRGLALGEHGIVGDVHPWLHTELVHLPLLVRWPGGADFGRRVHALTQPLDLMPTLLAAFGLALPPVDGHNLLPFLCGEREPVRSFACSALRLGDEMECALRNLEWSFLLPMSSSAESSPRGPQLYVQPDDHWEMNNVLQHHPELAEELERTLRTFVGEPGKAASGISTS